MKYNLQEKKWSSKFGEDYIKRNSFTLKNFNDSYSKHLGTTRVALNREFLGKLDRNIRILEVGTNIGLQLFLLKKMGFKNLYGIEINKKAINIAKTSLKDVNIIYGLAGDIPFKDDFFDLVFTSGVLIHISPKNINKVMTEMHRCTKRYIWGFEYFAEKYTNINYRGNNNLLWKANFCELFKESFDDLSIVKTKKIKRVNSDELDMMYLIKKIKHK